MKKLFALLFVLLMITPFSLGEGIDLSSLTFEELVALREQCTREMMHRDEWQEVVVPIGLYQIGVEIPAGKWTISAANAHYFSYVYGTELRSNGVEPIYDVHGIIDSPNSLTYEQGEPTEITLDLKEGAWLMIKNASVIFRPYTGPSFSFK